MWKWNWRSRMSKKKRERNLDLCRIFEKWKCTQNKLLRYGKVSHSVESENPQNETLYLLQQQILNCLIKNINLVGFFPLPFPTRWNVSFWRKTENRIMGFEKGNMAGRKDVVNKREVYLKIVFSQSTVISFSLLSSTSSNSCTLSLWGGMLGRIDNVSEYSFYFFSFLPFIFIAQAHGVKL